MEYLELAELDQFVPISVEYRKSLSVSIPKRFREVKGVSLFVDLPELSQLLFRGIFREFQWFSGVSLQYLGGANSGFTTTSTFFFFPPLFIFYITTLN